MRIELVQNWTVGGAVALFLLLGCFLARDGSSNRAIAVAGMLFCAGAASRALLTEPAFIHWSGPLLHVLTILCLGHAAAFLTFSRTLFEDGARIERRDAVVWVLLVAAGLLVFRGSDFRPELVNLRPLFTGAEILAAAAALAIAWRGVAGDLVERRRNARFAFVALASLHVVTLGVTEMALSVVRLSGWAGLLNSSGLVVVAAGLAFAIAGLRDENAFTAERAPPSEQRPRILKVVPPAVRSTTELAVADVRLFEQLQRLMESERIYRDESLTVRSLATRLSISEKTLRELINRRLGYRNFNAWLNARRLAEIKGALADPEQAGVPISTIAIDAGFRSLGPFNRAFREAEGMTPTEYRDLFFRQALEVPLPKSVSG